MADHFETLGLPRRFAVDLPDLERRFREQSREVHPDRFATASPPERRAALERSTALNDAYRTLKDPLRRATYFLELRGCSDLARWPENGSVRFGRLNARDCTGLTYLPDWLNHVGQLNLMGCARIERLPDTPL